MAKILIVEDDPLMLRMYQKIFTLEQYEVEVATNGEEALEKVHAGKPTIILLDIMMPKMNGLEVLSQLKADPQTQGIKIIMLTNVEDASVAKRAETLGASGYILKSQVADAELLVTIDSLLDPKKMIQ